MKTRFTSLLLATVFGAALITQAQATITLSGHSTDTTDLTNVLDLGITGYSSSPMTLNIGGSTVTTTFSGAAYVGNAIPDDPSLDVVGGTLVTTGLFFTRYDTSSVTFNYSSAQTNFGMIWGSPDDTNSVSFYKDNTLVAVYSRGEMDTLYTGGAASRYALFNFSDGQSFDKVVAGGETFEFTLLKASAWGAPDTAAMSAPAPAPVPLLGATLLGNIGGFGGLGALWAKRRKKLASA